MSLNTTNGNSRGVSPDGRITVFVKSIRLSIADGIPLIRGATDVGGKYGRRNTDAVASTIFSGDLIAIIQNAYIGWGGLWVTRWYSCRWKYT